MSEDRGEQQGGGGGLPGRPQGVPGAPENVQFYQLNRFEGLNTKFTRTGIGDQEMAWCDNLMPIGPETLAALPDLSSTVSNFNAASGTTMAGQPQFFNIGSVSYVAATGADGSLWVSNLSSWTNLLPASTFPVPGDTDFTQWANQFLLIISDNPSSSTSSAFNGYWIWDGSRFSGTPIPFQAGTLGPVVTIGNGGVGYTSAPTVGVYGGSGGSATFTATVNAGSVDTIVVTNPGSGWLASDAPTALLTFTGGGSTGVTAYGTCNVENGVIVGVVITASGSGYTSVPNVTVSGGSGTAQLFVTQMTISGTTGGSTPTTTFSVGAVEVGQNAGGNGYVGGTALTFSGGGSGSGAAGYIIVADGVLTGVSMASNGAGYGGTPDLEFISASGSGAAGTPQLSSGSITGVNLTNGGSGYSSPTIVAFNAANGPAYATVSLMPFGINGSTLVTYQGRVWVGRQSKQGGGTTGRLQYGPTILFGAPGDPANFGPPGGAFPFTDEFLRNQFVHIIVNGPFLYLVGDSSINYISGVSVTGTPPITTFSVTNVDPQTGSDWHDSVYVFGQSIMMANAFGVHALYGGTIKKVSAPLDGIYTTQLSQTSTGGGSFRPSSAVADVNGVRCYLFLLPVTNPATGATTGIVFMWDGRRWWTYNPSINLISITTQEVNSSLTAWGTDGNKLYQLFGSTPLGTISKVLYTKLWSAPSIAHEKKDHTLFMAVDSVGAANWSVTVHTDNGTSSSFLTSFATAGTTSLEWLRSRGPGAVGQMMGLDITSTSPTFTLRDILFAVQNRKLQF